MDIKKSNFKLFIRQLIEVQKDQINQFLKFKENKRLLIKIFKFKNNFNHLI